MLVKGIVRWRCIVDGVSPQKVRENQIGGQGGGPRRDRLLGLIEHPAPLLGIVHHPAVGG